MGVPISEHLENPWARGDHEPGVKDPGHKLSRLSPASAGSCHAPGANTQGKCPNSSTCNTTWLLSPLLQSIRHSLRAGLKRSCSEIRLVKCLLSIPVSGTNSLSQSIQTLGNPLWLWDHGWCPSLRSPPWPHDSPSAFRFSHLEGKMPTINKA